MGDAFSIDDLRFFERNEDFTIVWKHLPHWTQAATLTREQRGQVSLLRPAAAHQSLYRTNHRTDGHSRTRNAGAMMPGVWLMLMWQFRKRVHDYCLSHEPSRSTHRDNINGLCPPLFQPVFNS